MRVALTLLLGAACDRAEVPESCTGMCQAAGSLYATCLTDWGVDWSAAGYADEADFRVSCETWAWEMSILEADAIDRGALSEPGWLDRTCTERHSAFTAEDAECSTYSEVDWGQTPWSGGDTG